MIQNLIKYRLPIFFITIILTIICLNQLPQIVLNTDFSQFLSKTDKDYVFYQKVQSELKDDTSLLLLAITPKNDVLEVDFLRKVDTLISALGNISNVKSAKTITNLSFPIKSMLGIVQVPYISSIDEVTDHQIRETISRNEEIFKHFVNDDRSVLFTWITLKKGLSTTDSNNVLKEIHKIRKDFSGAKTFIWGKTYIKSSMDLITTQQTKQNIKWSFFVLIVVLLLMFKRIKAILFIVLYVSVAIILFHGTMVYFNRSFGLMSSLYPTIILIVGVSDCIHFSIKYNDELVLGNPPKVCFINSFREIGLAICITSATTTLGFFTLLFSPMVALRNFGLESGIAVVLTFLVFIMLSPMVYLGFGKSNTFQFRSFFDGISGRTLDLLKILRNRSKVVILSSVAVLLVAIACTFFINTNNKQYSIPANTELHRNYVFFENAIGGSRTFEVYFTSKDESKKINNSRVLGAIHKTYRYLEDRPYFFQVKSPSLYYQLMDKAYWPRKNFGEFDITDDQILLYEEYLNKYPETQYLINDDRTIMKISAQMSDLGRIGVETINHEVLDKIDSFLARDQVAARINGLDHLFDKTHSTRVIGMVKGLFLAIIIISILMGILYRSILLVLISLVLNIIPIVIIAGIMGMTNLELRAGTSMIFTIAFVIVVDDTIHMLNKFQLLRKQGINVEASLSKTILDCGKAIFATSLILLGAFFVLVFSNVHEIFSFGILISIALVIAFITDMVLGPILIKRYFGK